MSHRRERERGVYKRGRRRRREGEREREREGGRQEEPLTEVESRLLAELQ